MVANLWQGKGESPGFEAALLGAAETAQRVKDQLILGVDEDTQAFNAYMEARRLPAHTPEEKALRERKMQEGLKRAVEVPYRTAQASLAAMQAAWAAAQHGNVSSITDAAVGAQAGFAGVRGGIWNVLINLKDIADAAFVRDMREQCDALLRDATALLAQVTAHVDRRLAEQITRG
jgi:glutamate formiminotransferase/formiminotetrahydrofolate cyclodeaminase